MRKGKHEEGDDIYMQPEETKAIRMHDQSVINPMLCLMIIINEAARVYRWHGKNFSIPSSKKRLTIFAPTIKMFTTFIVLALMATFYPLALVCAAQNHHHQQQQQQQQHQPAQQVFRGSQNSHNLPSQLTIPQGNSIDVLKQQDRRGSQQPRPARAKRSPDKQGSMDGQPEEEKEQQPEPQQQRLPIGTSNGRPISVSSMANRQQAAAAAAASGSSNSLEASELPAVGGGQSTPLVATANFNRPPSSIIRNVTAQNGQSVLLHCLVEPSSELVVSWFRGTGEPQLLTYESNTVIDDQRFVVRHGLLKDDDWALQIKNLDKATDSGLYQCQTNSEPPQSQFYQLNVIEPQVNISGAPDMAVKLGSAINLTCIISQSPDQLQFIFWYRNDRMINYDINERGKIVISKWAQKQGIITSNLQISHSKLSDSGNYTCSPSGARPMSIYVHVLEGLDKRLTMFQNDNYEPSAASSQQTNSAISVHVVRLSKGRVYALFVAYVIFASWFQLVTQAQTAISFLLLAIIGFFLGKVTGNGESDDYQFKERKRTKQRRKKKKHEAALKANHQLLQDSQESGAGRVNDSNGTIDPLIRRANSALNLLKSLSSETGSTSTSNSNNNSDNDDDDDSDNLQDHETTKEQETTLQELARSQKVPLNSPSGASASTSSSFASTGYNSDSRSTNLVLVHPVDTRLHQNDDCRKLNKKRHCCFIETNDNGGGRDHDEGACEMIELVTEPTAMSLLMEQFGHERQPTVFASASSESPSPMFSSQAGTTTTTTTTTTSSSHITPIKPPRLGEPVQLPQQKQLASVEPHYSSPTNSLSFPSSRGH